MNIVIAPDKFKGSLTAQEIVECIERLVKEVLPDAQYQSIPLADGGEGSLAILIQKTRGELIELAVQDPLFRKIKAQYLKVGETAFIEMSRASGLQLIEESERNCMKTSTFGTGQLIVDALQRQVEQIYLLIGGSATNDAGIGMAKALGYNFLDVQHESLVPIGKNLSEISEIIIPEDWNVNNVKFKVVCDVKNPLYGANGAAQVYAKQKGANEQEIAYLDKGLKHFNELVKNNHGIDFQTIEGSGAAGGLGAGAMLFLNAEMISGIEFMMEISGFNTAIEWADLVITGEGKIDKQTLQGKVVKGVAAKTRAKNKRLWVVCGQNELNESEIKKLAIEQLIVLNDDEKSISWSMENAEKLIEQKIRKAFIDYLKGH